MDPSVPRTPKDIESRLLESPAYVAIVVRWITWAVAAAVIAFRAAPEENLANAIAALGVTGAWCVAITLFGPVLRPPMGEARWLRAHLTQLTSAFDIVLSAFVIWWTGGFRSPFYEYALTSVIAPSLLFRMRGAMLAASSFCILYFAAVLWSSTGLAATIREGVVDGTLFSSILNPFTVAIFVALLGHLMLRLREERQRSAELAALQERDRIAREIHDGIAQRIFMLTLSLETCAEVASRAQADGLRTRLEDLIRLSKQALWEVRHYIFDLKPLLEGESGLVQGLQNQVREFRTITGLQVDLQVTGEERPVAVPCATAAYRLVQEALANTYKHAQAKAVSIRVEYAREGLRLGIEDDGAGFAVASTPRGVGLGSMCQRAVEVGGECALESAPGRGTTVRATLPYAPLAVKGTVV